MVTKSHVRSLIGFQYLQKDYNKEYNWVKWGNLNTDIITALY